MDDKQTDQRKNPPDILYHYTTIEGFKGIIEAGKIWATDLRFLNDFSEFKYAFDLAEEELFFRPISNQLFGLPPCEIEKKDEYVAELIKKILQNEKFVDLNVRTYVTSFTEEGDLLSQWRAYCPNGGVSIGFERQSLNKIFKKAYDLELCKCDYDKGKQIKLLYDIFDEFEKLYGANINELKEAKNDNAQKASEIFNKLSIDLLMEIAKLSPSFKHPKFEEEKEWRLFVIGKFLNISEMPFRLKQTHLVPYADIPIVDENQNIPIKKIIIAPTSHKELAKISIDSFMQGRKGIDIKCRVEHSEIPYRASY